MPTQPPNYILVVEDDGEIRRLIAKILTCSGYAVDTAEDGAVAWDSLQVNDYDLLVTDHNMPKVSGVELLQKLHVAHKVICVIMVSGAIPTSELDSHPWLKIGATLLKPFTPEQLLAVVKNVMPAMDGASG